MFDRMPRRMLRVLRAVHVQHSSMITGGLVVIGHATEALGERVFGFPLLAPFYERLEGARDCSGTATLPRTTF